MKLNTKAVATTFAIWSVLLMSVIWLLANAGLYVSAAEQMAKWHIFFNLNVEGLIAGAIEAAVVSYVLVYAFAWTYSWVKKML